MTAPEPVTAADPVTREIIRGKLLALADEMGIVIAKTSMSPVIYEVLDFACGLCDADGELVVQTNGITLFTGTFAPQVRSIMRRHGETMRPGDVFMTNDPFEGGTHSCDIALIKPIFVDGRLFAFAISVAHWSEVGGAVPGSISPTATEIYQEGVRFPGIRVCRDDETIDDVIALIRENVRLPVQSLGDFNAGLAAVRIAETRLREVIARYGLASVKGTFDHILETSERLSRAAVAALPDGDYEAEDWIDATASPTSASVSPSASASGATRSPSTSPVPARWSRGPSTAPSAPSIRRSRPCSSRWWTRRRPPTRAGSAR